jgi:hypothetical protein
VVGKGEEKELNKKEKAKTMPSLISMIATLG